MTVYAWWSTWPVIGSCWIEWLSSQSRGRPSTSAVLQEMHWWTARRRYNLFLSRVTTAVIGSHGHVIMDG